eukprot:scaffold10297_cov113-Isochrysis_galbana.AAC.14
MSWMTWSPTVSRGTASTSAGGASSSTACHAADASGRERGFNCCLSRVFRWTVPACPRLSGESTCSSSSTR